METINNAVKIVKLLALCYCLCWVANKAPKAVRQSHKFAQEIANTTNACASHTAAANEVIDFASR